MRHSTEELGSQLRTSSGQCIPLAGRALGKSITRAPKEVYSTHAVAIHCTLYSLKQPKLSRILLDTTATPHNTYRYKRLG